LHKHSQRSNGTFVAINTAAIPKDLLESELFGHERGAFTGAQTMRRGRFEQAEGGTLFLDEIGDMPFDLQTRLLRVLSDGNFYRVGGHTSIKANVRVIAATHQDLEQRVKDGAFREDLFHRLNVIRLRLPALRERKEDIPVLTHFFLKQSAVQLGVEPKRISAPAISVLTSFPFPGNVRQLENICHWLSVMTPSQVIEPKDLPPEVLEFYTTHKGQLQAVNGVPDLVHPPKDGITLSEHLESQRANSATPAQANLSSFPESTELSQPGHSSTSYAPVDSISPHEYSIFQGGQVHTTWEHSLEMEANALLSSGQTDVWDILTRKFEAKLIQTALNNTKGRRIEAALKLGIGRNTITRKIQELGLEG
jgi:two-component system, NtrC family, nitrogen regulation response regulator GlnG